MPDIPPISATNLPLVTNPTEAIITYQDGALRRVGRALLSVFNAAQVLNTVLSGLSTATQAAVTAADTVLSAIGKLQATKADLTGAVFTGNVDIDTATVPRLRLLSAAEDNVTFGMYDKQALGTQHFEVIWSASSNVARFVCNAVDVAAMSATTFEPKLPVSLMTYTVAQANALPSIGSGKIIYCSNGNAGAPCLAISIGGVWQRINAGAAISAT